MRKLVGTPKVGTIRVGVPKGSVSSGGGGGGAVAYVPMLNFSNALNSQYIALLLSDD